ncbi:MAG TPA: hypothetical protein VHB20_13925 [Verrucomicrobiae bacterium]|jgi:hypothetical protein|nr:hypothetical protein [Verrucomicrobiae bacterium]
MQRILASFILLTLFWAPSARALEGKVLKVFPQYLDEQGRHTLAPSLFARDAYQAILRKTPSRRSGMRVAVQWKAQKGDWSNLKVRVEMRGLRGNTLRRVTLEKPAVKNGWFSNWIEVRLTGDDYKDFGELVAWRVSLWDGATQVSSQQSFLWNGAEPAR